MSKRQRNAVVPKFDPKPKTYVVDLMSALYASVARTTYAPALEDLTKAELIAIAADFDLAGRSTMNKAELVAALSAAGATAQGRAQAAVASA